MSLEIFVGDHLPTLLARVSKALGPDACVVQLKRRGTSFELIASDGSGTFGPIAAPSSAAAGTADGPDFRAILDARIDAGNTPVAAAPIAPAPRAEPVAVPTPRPEPALAPPLLLPSAPLPERPAFMVRPWIIALVGPTGAGKTTTIAKLATNPLGFGGCRVGLLGLDTYRVGAVEQLETYADLADLPAEIVYSGGELTRAMSRLNRCEVVLVDTPGRGPRNAADAETIRGWLKELAPDEVHLTLPAGQLPAVSRRLLQSYAGFNITHLLATKLDEHPGETGLFDLAVSTEQRMRWITDGQEVPADIALAADAIAAATSRAPFGITALESCA